MEFTEIQLERIAVMKKILEVIGDNFVLKGGTALMMYYGLDRFSEDIDLDAKTTKLDISKQIEQLAKKEGWNTNIKKNTDTTFRIMIDYNGRNDFGNYPLKVEISGRDSIFLKENDYIETNEGILYRLKKIINFKENAFSQRNKARDIYDLHFMLENYQELFNYDQLQKIYSNLQYKGWEVLADEINQDNLIKIDGEKLIMHTVYLIEKIIEKEKDNKIELDTRDYSEKIILKNNIFENNHSVKNFIENSKNVLSEEKEEKKKDDFEY